MAKPLIASYPSRFSANSITPLNPTAEEICQSFEAIECGLPFTSEESFGDLLTFTNNLNDPVHRWFFYKESYSPQLAEKVIERYQLPDYHRSVLDPFCGAGTTLLAAQSCDLNTVGIELNPFAAFLSQVKLRRFEIEPGELEKTFKNVLSDRKSNASNLPELTTFHNEKYFPDGSIFELIKLKDAICRRKASAAVKDVLLLALTATLSDVSCLRRDGRMLRYEPRTVIPPREAFQLRVRAILEDIQALLEKPKSKASIFQGDARNIVSILKKNAISRKFGLILYSPPYPNNFDYSEIYKCELWLTGFISSYEQWLNLRRQTLRSHPSCEFPLTTYLKDSAHREIREIFRLVEQAARCSNIGGYAEKRAPKVIRGYFDDIFLCLQQQISVLAPGGHIVCVVGNAQHGGLHIPADSLIAKIGQSLGLELVEICVAKLRMSRNQQVRKLRESLVVLRKPKCF